MNTKMTVVGLSVDAFFVLAVLGYVAWNVLVRRKPVLRMFEKVAAEVGSDKDKAREFARKVAPGLISANAGMASITIAALFIAIIGFRIRDFAKFTDLEQTIVYVILGLSAVSASCWLFCIEQLSQVLPGLLEPDKILRLYRRSMNL